MGESLVDGKLDRSKKLLEAEAVALRGAEDSASRPGGNAPLQATTGGRK
jgi:hypothetical protein